MKFCTSCGKEIAEDAVVCVGCGKAVAGKEPAAGAKDNTKTMSILAYLLFFIPLITGDYKKSETVKFHANQGLVLWLAYIAWMILSAIVRAVVQVETTSYLWGVPYTVKTTPGWLSLILSLMYIPYLVLVIMGLINASKGQEKELPVIGKFKILK